MTLIEGEWGERKKKEKKFFGNLFDEEKQPPEYNNVQDELALPMPPVFKVPLRTMGVCFADLLVDRRTRTTNSRRFITYLFPEKTRFLGTNGVEVWLAERRQHFL